MVVQTKRKIEELREEILVQAEHEDSGSENEENHEVSEEEELTRLKGLIPSLSRKENVTQLDVILEAIRYIDSLRGKLINIIPKPVEV